MRLGSMTIQSLMLLAVLFVHSQHSYAQVFNDHDQITQEHESYLADKYKPHYIFYPNCGLGSVEHYYYMNPPFFIDKHGAALNDLFAPYNNNAHPFNDDSSNIWRISYKSITRTPPQGEPFSSFIGKYCLANIQQADPDMYSAMLSDSGDPDDLPWGDLHLVRPSIWEYDYLLIDDIKYHYTSTAPIFYIVEQNDDGNIELQYWAFSHADDKDLSTDAWYNADHLCDWSHVAIVFKAYRDNSNYFAIEPPLYSYYSAHRNVVTAEDADSPFHPRYLSWEDVSRTPDGHPIVLVSGNQHELYYESVRAPVYGFGYFYCGDQFNYSYNNGTSCNSVPYLIQDHVGSYYYDRVGDGIDFEPEVLVPLGNASHPNPDTPWVTFGGKWVNGPEGPLGAGARAEFRQHCLVGDPPGSAGSVNRTFVELERKGQNEWLDFCSCGDCDPPPSLEKAVLMGLGFMRTQELVTHDSDAPFELADIVGEPYAGDLMRLTWHTPAGRWGSIDLGYSTDRGCTWRPIAENIEDAGWCDWVLPPDTQSQAYIVRITHDIGTVSGAIVADYSNLFTVQGRPLVVSKPYLAFGNAPVSSTKQRLLWVRNAGTTPIDLTPECEGEAFCVEGGAVTRTIGAGDSMCYRIAFEPRAEGLHYGRILWTPPSCGSVDLDGQCIPPWRDRSAFFNGREGGIRVSNSASLDIESDLTIELMVRPCCVLGAKSECNAIRSYVLYKGGPEASAGKSWAIILEPDGAISYFTWGVLLDRIATSSHTLSTNEYSHVAITYQERLLNSKCRIYVNGELSKEEVWYGKALYSSDEPLNMGGGYLYDQGWRDRRFHGSIDELRIWERVRTQAEIQATMSNVLDERYYASPDSGLVAYYRLDKIENLEAGQPGVNDVRDYSSYMNHGDIDDMVDICGRTEYVGNDVVFRAYMDANVVIVKWDVRSDIVVCGVVVWRENRTGQRMIVKEWADVGIHSGECSDAAVEQGQWYYWLEWNDVEGGRHTLGPQYLSIESEKHRAQIDLVRPNPFNAETMVSYEVSRQMHVRLGVYDQMGRCIRMLVDGVVDEGAYEVEWDGKNAQGRRMPSGSYAMLLKTEEGVSSVKVVMVK